MQPQELRNRTDFFIYTCDHQSTQIWAGAIFGYLALLQIAALFLAFGTRKVKVKGLNDSLYITATVYSTSVLLVFIITVSIILSDRVNLYAVLLSTSIIMAATVILGLVFIPKVSFCSSQIITSHLPLLYRWCGCTRTLKGWRFSPPIRLDSSSNSNL